MRNLIKLFSILQLTKEQPLTGYLTAGVKLHETATLAEHHYTATLMAYFLMQKIKKAGGQIDADKVMKMLLIHDLSELFGGDTAAPMNRKYPELKIHKDKIGEKAIELLAGYLDDESREELKKLFDDFEYGDSDEVVVGKILDQMDHQFFLEHHSYKTRYYAGEEDYRPKFVEKYIYNLTEKIKDEKTKQVMDEFLSSFKKYSFNKGFQSLTILMED